MLLLNINSKNREAKQMKKVKQIMIPENLCLRLWDMFDELYNDKNLNPKYHSLIKEFLDFSIEKSNNQFRRECFESDLKLRQLKSGLVDIESHL